MNSSFFWVFTSIFFNALHNTLHLLPPRRILTRQRLHAGHKHVHRSRKTHRGGNIERSALAHLTQHGIDFVSCSHKGERAAVPFDNFIKILLGAGVLRVSLFCWPL